MAADRMSLLPLPALLRRHDIGRAEGFTTNLLLPAALPPG
jgi:hypothetical protein